MPPLVEEMACSQILGDEPSEMQSKARVRLLFVYSRIKLLLMSKDVSQPVSRHGLTGLRSGWVISV